MEKAFIVFQHLLPKHLVSQLLGVFARSEKPWLKNLLIRLFIKAFGVNMDEAVHSRPEDYRNFNEFFTRPLKEGLRPLAAPESQVLCPADGAVSQIGQVHAGQIFQAKGRQYSCSELLAGSADASLFEDGCFVTVYLSPKDYHRVHMPSGGRLIERCYVPGKLFSVNQITARNVPRLFSQNERLVCIFDGPQGRYAMVMVGAVVVAGIETVWGESSCSRGGLLSGQLPEVRLEAGDEMGRFFLGSTVIMLYPKDTLQWREDLREGSPLRMGESLGNWERHS